MDRYGQDFDRDQWGGRGQDQGWRRGRGGESGWGGETFGGRGGWEGNQGEWEGYGGNLRGQRGGYGQDFDEWGGSWRGGQGGLGNQGRQFGGSFGGGYGSGRNLGGYGGMGGQRQGYGGEFMGGFGRGGYQGGYGGYSDFQDEQRVGYGGGWGGRGGQQQTGNDQDRVRAAEIMTENPETVMPDTPLAEAARKMRDLNVGIIPVVESQESRRLRGVVTDRDIAIRAVAEGKDISGLRVSEVMTTDVETCNKNDTVGDVLNLMQREQVRRVPITDREGRLVGIVAQADVAVDFLEVRPQGKREVARTLQRVSEPAEPQLAGAGMQARGRTAGRGQQQSTGQQGTTTRGSVQRGEE